MSGALATYFIYKTNVMILVRLMNEICHFLRTKRSCAGLKLLSRFSTNEAQRKQNGEAFESLPRKNKKRKRISKSQRFDYSYQINGIISERQVYISKLSTPYLIHSHMLTYKKKLH